MMPLQNAEPHLIEAFTSMHQRSVCVGPMTRSNSAARCQVGRQFQSHQTPRMHFVRYVNFLDPSRRLNFLVSEMHGRCLTVLELPTGLVLLDGGACERVSSLAIPG